VADANELATGASLEEGQKLIIPAASRSEASTGKLIRYRVRRTDTIATIADEFDVTTAELRKWNHLRADHVVRGTSLRIYPGGMTPAPPAPQRQAKAKDTTVASNSTLISQRSGGAKQNLPVMEARPASTVVHRVKAGETLWSIARAYQTTVEAIQAGNRYLFSRPLQVGDTLTILPTR
jgi:membrane-bound lytic murein transglycosylase D